jgi:hypothetical protein
MNPEKLHVITAVSNPLRWQSRINLYKDFETHMLDSGVNLTVVECAYGERPHELANSNKFIKHIPVRAKTLVWNKENLLNIGVQRTPEAKYIAWADADIYFRKPSWASDTVHALQQYDILQPWTDAFDMGPKDELIQTHKSFCFQYHQGFPVVSEGPNFWKFNNGPYHYPHPGYCWAATRQTLDWLGGLLEIAIMGAGDHHMALSLIGHGKKSIPKGVHPSYWDKIRLWEERALRHINHNIGFVYGAIEHAFHGKKDKRKYVERWDTIVKHGFNPDTDIKKNTHGVLEFSGNKPHLRRDIDLYFRQRDEDSNTLG